MRPAISVIIPAYNNALTLGEAIASVRQQDYGDLEIIVVDDGSSDHTAQVLAELAGDDLRSIKQTNAGAATARNAGLGLARGEWIAFLDADDFWLPGKLAVQMEEMERHPRADFSYTDVRLRFKDGTEREWGCGTEGQPLLMKLLTGNLFATPTTLVRRQCFEKVGLFDEELRTGEDWDMWLRLAAHFEHVHVARPLSLIRATDQTKLPLPVLERCTLRVLDRLFSCPTIEQRWPEVAEKRRLVYAWHYSVLAKSYWRKKILGDFFRLALRAIGSHPAALHYIAQSRRERQ